MSNYTNRAVAEMRGIPLSQLSKEQREVLKKDGKRRQALIKKTMKQVLENNQVAFDNVQVMEQYLTKMYDKVGRELLAQVMELRAEVERAGGEWDIKSMGKHQRMENLLKQINDELGKLGADEVNFMQKNLSTVYQDQYLREIYALGQFMNVNISMDSISPELVRQAINYPWSGAMFSDRIWENKRLLGNNLRLGITQSMILGESMGKVANRIREGISTSKFNAMRVARSEVMRVSYIAERKAMEEHEINEVKYWATIPSERTCKHCGSLHENVYEMGKEPMLPIHPQCRCTYVPIIKDIDYTEGLNKTTEGIRGTDNYTEWRDDEVGITGLGGDVDIDNQEVKYTGKVGKDIALKFNKGNEVYLANNRRILDYVLKYDNTLTRGYDVDVTYGDYSKFAEARDLTLQLRDGIYTNDKPYDVEFKKVKFKFKTKLGTSFDNSFYVPTIIEYEEMEGGKYFLAYNSKVKKADKLLYEEDIKNFVEKNPRAVGIKVRIDNSALGSDTGERVTLGQHKPRVNTIVMRTHDSYNKVYGGNIGREHFTKTFTHELGHIVHSKEPILERMTMTTKEWDEWKDTIENYYDFYRKNRIVNISREWHRFTYPVHAEDYYSDRSKEHFYEEMWAESTSVLHMEDEEEIKKLDKYFPKIKDFVSKIYSR